MILDAWGFRLGCQNDKTPHDIYADLKPTYILLTKSASRSYITGRCVNRINNIGALIIRIGFGGIFLSFCEVKSPVRTHLMHCTNSGVPRQHGAESYGKSIHSVHSPEVREGYNRQPEASASHLPAQKPSQRTTKTLDETRPLKEGS